MSQGAGPGRWFPETADAHHGVELRHLRYLVAVADAGTFTRAAQWLSLAQPTLSQGVRRLEEMVGTPLLERRREGVRLTQAGRVLVEESRTVLSLIEQGVRRSRHAGGVDRLRLRFVLSPTLPEGFAGETAARLRSVAAMAGLDVTWLEAALDASLSTIGRRQADAALGWVVSDPAGYSGPVEVMVLGEFEPEAWIPARAGTGKPGAIELAELAGMDVIHGPRRRSPVTYDAWLEVFRSVRPGFEFTDPPPGHALALAFAATARRPTAVLTGPLYPVGEPAAPARERAAGTGDLARVRLGSGPLRATAALAWSGDLPRHLQQVLFDTADTAISATRRPDRQASTSRVEGSSR
jgi:DNA-binding transcriptional LysR family regulator